jgi:hypothetical protein
MGIDAMDRAAKPKGKAFRLSPGLFRLGSDIAIHNCGTHRG